MPPCTSQRRMTWANAFFYALRPMVSRVFVFEDINSFPLQTEAHASTIRCYPGKTLRVNLLLEGVYFNRIYSRRYFGLWIISQ